MPYLANKTMNLSGTEYRKGEPVPSRVVDKIPEYRLGSLLRTRLLIEVDTLPGDMCPHCEGGPFQRLAQHISLKHEDVLPPSESPDTEASVEVSDDSPEETDGNN